MHVIQNNSINLKKFFLGFLVALTFLAPLSVSFRETTSSIGGTPMKLTSVSAQTNAGEGGQTPSSPENTPGLANQLGNQIVDETLEGGSDLGQAIGYAVLSTAAAITWVGGNLLEYSIDNLVFKMGEKLNTDGLGSSIDITWKVIRDICNLIFIFGFIYTGIRTIIDPESAETKRFVAQIIIAALLINFSLFFVKVITDFSNFTAVKIYSTMVSDTHDGEISTKFTELLGLKTLYHPPEGDKLAGITATGGIWFFILGAIMLLVAGFVFAAGGILLIVRFVALIFIMIFSPVLFAASVFPQTEEYSSKLWHHLISYAFFAPLFLLLLLISITVLNGAMGALGITNDSLSGALVKADSYTVILNFVIVIMFLIFSLKTASSLGVAGGEMAVHMGDHLRQNVQGAIGRNTVGRASRGLLHAYEHFDASTADSKGWKVAKFAGKALTFGAVDDMTITHALHAGENAKFGSHYSNEDVHKHKEEHNKRIGRINKEHDRQHDIDHGTDAIKEAATPGAPPPNPETLDKMIKAIKGLTTDQMKDMDMKILTKEDVAVHLSIKQIDELEKTGKYSDADITKIKDAKKAGFRNMAGAAGATRVKNGTGDQSMHEILAARGAEEAAKMPMEVFASREMAPYLTPEMVEAKMKSGISNTERDEIKDNIQRHIGSLPPTDPYVNQWRSWVRRPIGARLGLII